MIDVDLDRVTIPFVWQELFARAAPTDVEIGAGKGWFLNEFAAANPDRNVLAVERAAKYHRLCCERAARRGLTNVRALRTTAEDLFLRLLPDGSVDTLFVLFPDPWPKKRHHKRRLFQPLVLEVMGHVLTEGGRLLVKTDHDEYAAEIGERISAATVLKAIDPERAFAGLPQTGFETKYRAAGRVIHAFAAERVAGRLTGSG